MTDQLDLALAESRSRDITRRANKVSRKASKARRSLPVLQPELVADHAFTPVAGVPVTRADCPKDGGLCPHVRCRWHLFAESADHRAGRPGLGSVPRDERGLTLPVSGHMGNERPGTTLRPAWLQWRGLEVEREVKVYIDREGNVSGIRKGTLEYWLDRLHMGEPVLVFDDQAVMIARAKLTADGLAMDGALPEEVICSSSAIVLTRVRGVSSCALDEIARHGKPMTNEQVGDCVGRHRTLVARENRKAVLKGIANARNMGLTKDEFLRGLRELGAGG